MCRLEDGSIFCWGKNDNGQLGTGVSVSHITNKSLIPLKVTGISTAIQVSNGESHSCALLENGKIMCWGRGDRGQLGSDKSYIQNTPVEVPELTRLFKFQMVEVTLVLF